MTDRLHAEVWRRKGYFLSAAIDLPPASNFGSLGLTIALAAFAAVAVVRHRVVAERLRAANLASSLAVHHHSSLAAAIVAVVGGHGVAAYQHNQSHTWHNTFAAMFVLCALLHFHLESSIERAAGLSSRVARATRLTLVCVATIGCATFLSHVVVEEMHRKSIGIGKLRAAVAEIVSCACFVFYLATYSRSFHESQITLTVTVPTAHAHGAADGAGGSLPLCTAAPTLPWLQARPSPTEENAPLIAPYWPTPLRTGSMSCVTQPTLRRCRSAGEAIGGAGWHEPRRL